MTIKKCDFCTEVSDNVNYRVNLFSDAEGKGINYDLCKVDAENLTELLKKLSTDKTGIFPNLNVPNNNEKISDQKVLPKERA